MWWWPVQPLYLASVFCGIPPSSLNGTVNSPTRVIQNHTLRLRMSSVPPLSWAPAFLSVQDWDCPPLGDIAFILFRTLCSWCPSMDMCTVSHSTPIEETHTPSGRISEHTPPVIYAFT
ncbi:hypothetical protein CPB86DRAFT_386407 [Serendipita vermifera]|nr:hypothetical protein CPB86DRAFT_386407 [Serendipita vermifera]